MQESIFKENTKLTEMINIYEPYLTTSSRDYLIEAYDSTWISSQGKYKQKSEKIISEILNVSEENLFLCSNGTAATHLCAIALKYRYPKIKRILVPDNVYVAAWNSFIMNPTFDLVPIKTNIETWNIDLVDLNNKITDTDAVLIVHNVGNIINVPKLKRMYPNNVFIEDNCEGLFGRYENKSAGTESFCSSFSFFANKSITSGEGGLFFCKDLDVLRHVKKVHGQGMSSSRYIHDVLGYNYRMTNLQAAILLGQLEDHKEILQRKESLWKRYTNNFKNEKNIILQKIETRTVPARWIYSCRLLNKSYKLAELFMRAKNIDSRPMFYPMSTHNHLKKYANIEGESNARKLNEQCLMIPSHPKITFDQVDMISENLIKFVKQDNE
jgi:perosamine synthetase